MEYFFPENSGNIQIDANSPWNPEWIQCLNWYCFFNVRFCGDILNENDSTDLPPVPLWLVKSPPWHIKSGITLKTECIIRLIGSERVWRNEVKEMWDYTWNEDPLYRNPFSPVQSARKFSAVLGTTSALKVISMRPASLPPMIISK